MPRFPVPTTGGDLQDSFLHEAFTRAGLESIGRPMAAVPSGSTAASTDLWKEEDAMAETTVVIAPTTVPREDLGHGESLLTTAVG